MHQIIHFYNLHTTCIQHQSFFSVQEPDDSNQDGHHTNLTVNLPTTTLF